MIRNSLTDVFFAKDDVENLHEGVLRVLGEVGVKIENDEALGIFEQHGARVENGTVYIGEALLEKALQTVPANFELQGFDRTVPVGLDHDPVVIPTNGTPMVLNFDGSYSDTNTDDLVNFYKLIDTSDVMQVTSEIAVDVPGLDKTKDSLLAQTALLMKYSHKPIYNILGATIHNYKKGSVAQGVRENIQFAKKYYGYDDKYVIYSGTCVISPLGVGWEAMDHFMGFIKENQPISITACSMTNLTAPGSLYGSVVEDAAAILSIVVLSQLMNPGLPVLYTSLSSMSDMRYVQLCMGAPEFALITLGHIALANFYKIPVRVGGALGDAFKADYQAGVESFVGLMAPMLSQAAMIPHGCGTMGSFNLTSYEKFIMDEETIRYLMRLRRCFEVSDKRKEKALKDITKVGPRGNFLGGRTPKEYREDNYLASEVFNRKGCKENTREEQGDIRDRARKVYDARMEAYELPDTTLEQKKLLNTELPEQYKFDI